MIPALKTSGAFLAIPASLWMLGWSEVAFAWIIALQFPPYFALTIILLVVLLFVGLIELRPFSFLAFGSVSAGLLLVPYLWSLPSEWPVALRFVTEAVLVAASAFVPFAAVQFLLALFVSPRAPSPEEPS
jgi:hypothetical protein